MVFNVFNFTEFNIMFKELHETSLTITTNLVIACPLLYGEEGKRESFVGPMVTIFRTHYMTYPEQLLAVHNFEEFRVDRTQIFDQLGVVYFFERLGSRVIPGGM